MEATNSSLSFIKQALFIHWEGAEVDKMNKHLYGNGTI